MIRIVFYPRRYNNSMVNPDGTVYFLRWMHIGKSKSLPTRNSSAGAPANPAVACQTTATLYSSGLGRCHVAG